MYIYGKHDNIIYYYVYTYIYILIGVGHDYNDNSKQEQVWNIIYLIYTFFGHNN